jgi:hypothetical protein
VIVALRSSVTSGGSLFWRLPDLLDAVANTIKTNVPTTHLPELAAIIDEVGTKNVVQVVIGHPLVASANTKYGSSQVPKIDKIQAVAARLARGLVHLKTAGTSYLEALRTIAALDAALFRSLYAFARERYDTDKATYHVSAELGRAPEAKDVKEAALPDLLEHFHAREILHVTFGSVLKQTNPDGSLRFKDELFGLLRGNPEAYAANLERHFIKHLKPFVGGR